MPTNAPRYSNGSVWFNGEDMYMATDPFTLDQPILIYIVMRQLSWTSGDVIFDGNVDLATILKQDDTTSKLIASAGTESDENTHLALNTWGIVRVQFHGAFGNLIVDEETAVVGNFGAANMGGFNLGSKRSATGQFADIEVKEVIIRSIDDSDANEALIYNYLESKYNMADTSGLRLNVSDCENLDYTSFANGTPIGFDVTSNGAAEHNAGTADEIALVVGQKYVVSFEIFVCIDYTIINFNVFLYTNIFDKFKN